MSPRLAPSTRRTRRGANALEFAMILPALLLFLFGIVEFSWVFNRYLLVSNASQSAARLAAMTPADEDPVPVATAEAQAQLSEDPSQVQVTVTVTGQAPTRIVQVTVTVPFESLTSYIPGVPNSLTATTSLRMEDQPGS